VGAGEIRRSDAGCDASEKSWLMKVNYDNGHFTEEKLSRSEIAGMSAFLLWQTGHKDFSR
jgi:prolyl oligopeptidase